MDFNIRPAAKSCAASGRVFYPGDVCWSVLVEEGGRLQRQDFSVDSWQGPPSGAIGHWRFIIPENTESTRLTLDADSLFDYFVQLNDSPNIVQRQYRYVLSLLLMRKRRLILEEVVEIDDVPTMRMVGSAGEGPFDVPEEELTEEQIAKLQEQLFESGSGGITDLQSAA
jgi:hypothetical protein